MKWRKIILKFWNTRTGWWVVLGRAWGVALRYQNDSHCENTKRLKTTKNDSYCESDDYLTWGQENIRNPIYTDANRIEIWLTLLQPVGKENLKDLTWRKETQPRLAHREPATGRGGQLDRESWSLNPIHALRRPRACCRQVTWLEKTAVRSPLWCCRRLLFEHLPAFAVPEKMKNCAFASEWWELNEKFRLDIGQARPLGMNSHSRKLQVILWHRVDEKELSFGTSTVGGRRKEC